MPSRDRNTTLPLRVPELPTGLYGLTSSSQNFFVAGGTKRMLVILRWGSLVRRSYTMSPSAPVRAVRPAAWTPSSQLERSVLNDGTASGTLAHTLLAIRQRRGALFMLDSSRWLIERWNLASDCLYEQNEETVRLVERLLKS